MADSIRLSRQKTALPHPREEGVIEEAEQVASEISNADKPLGEPGSPVNRRSAFFIGLTGMAGVLVAAATAYVVISAGYALVLIGMALFIAVGVHPLVTWLVDHKVRRPLAVTTVALALILFVGGFGAAVVPLVQQGGRLSRQVAAYLRGDSVLGQLNQRIHLVDIGRSVLGSPAPEATGRLVVESLSATLVVIVLSIYFMADMPRVRRTLYRLVPHSRRPRVILIGDAVFTKVGAYLLGNLVISVITGSVMFAWLLLAGVPYALLLAIVVAVLDFVPVVGSLVAGALVSLLALTVSLPACLATVGVFVVYKLLEDYVLFPKIIGKVVAVPPLVTLIAVLVGGVLGGVLGAVVAIPIAAALQLVLVEVSIPRLDEN